LLPQLPVVKKYQMQQQEPTNAASMTMLLDKERLFKINLTQFEHQNPTTTTINNITFERFEEKWCSLPEVSDSHEPKKFEYR
jgi:hypothetical protein